MTETAAPSKYDNQSLGSLQLQYESLRQLAEQNKAEQAEILEELTRRTGTTLMNKLKAAGKEHGSVTVELPNGVKVKGERKQKVEWDQAKLRQIASTLTWEQIQHYFKITFSVPEKVYGALDPTMRLQKAFEDARTTKLDDLKVVFVPRKD